MFASMWLHSVGCAYVDNQRLQSCVTLGNLRVQVGLKHRRISEFNWTRFNIT